MTTDDTPPETPHTDAQPDKAPPSTAELARRVEELARKVNAHFKLLGRRP